MESIITLLTTLNSLSPLAVIGLLGLVIYMLVKGKTAAGRKLEEVKDNHLHELPGMAADIRTIADAIQRMEVKMGEEFSYIKARINGKPS